MSDEKIPGINERIKQQSEEFVAVSKLAEKNRNLSMTPIVDDDYKSVRAEYEIAVNNVIQAFKNNKRIQTRDSVFIADEVIFSDSDSRIKTVDRAECATQQEKHESFLWLKDIAVNGEKNSDCAAIMIHEIIRLNKLEKSMKPDYHLECVYQDDLKIRLTQCENELKILQEKLMNEKRTSERLREILQNVQKAVG